MPLLSQTENSQPENHHAMTSSRRIGRAAVTALFATASLTAAAPTSLAAQGGTSGAVPGTVPGRTGRPIEGVQIQVQNRQTGFSTGALTRTNGFFLVQGLEVGGPYTVRARRIGFEAGERNDVFVRLSETTRLDIQLGQTAVQLGTVEVRA